MIVEFEGHRHEFPEGTSQEDIAAALQTHAGRPASYWDNLKQTFTEAVERTARGGRQLAQGAREWRDDLKNPQPGMATHEPGEGYGFAPLDVVAGGAKMGPGGRGAGASPLQTALAPHA